VEIGMGLICVANYIFHSLDGGGRGSQNP
jgi:hypothetical protein